MNNISLSLRDMAEDICISRGVIMVLITFEGLPCMANYLSVLLLTYKGYTKAFIIIPGPRWQVLYHLMKRLYEMKLQWGNSNLPFALLLIHVAYA